MRSSPTHSVKQQVLSLLTTQPSDLRYLAVFRILFGVFMLINISSYIRQDMVRQMFVLPHLNFTYDFLSWLRPLPEPVLHGILWCLAVLALAMAAGVWFKWACRIFAIAYAYIFLLDKSLYNNHIYLFILIALLLSFTEADRRYSFNRKTKRNEVEGWQIGILRLQILIVYFFGGIAKLKYDWIVRCEPTKTLLQHVHNRFPEANWVENEVVVWVINYGGLLIDLGAPLFLLAPSKWRWIGLSLFAIFNFSNSWLFSDIGYFPYVMLGALMLFLPGADPKGNAVRRHNRFQQERVDTKELIPSPVFGGKYNAVLIAFFLFQLLFPLRGFFLPNNQDWTTIGNRFSWRMKVDTRVVNPMQFFIVSSTQAQPVPVEIQTFINDTQMLNLSMDPRSMIQFAQFLKSEAAKYGAPDAKITATMQVRYNGYNQVAYFSPEIDLTSESVNPLKRLHWFRERPH